MLISFISAISKVLGAKLKLFCIFVFFLTPGLINVS